MIFTHSQIQVAYKNNLKQSTMATNHHKFVSAAAMPNLYTMYERDL